MSSLETESLGGRETVLCPRLTSVGLLPIFVAGMVCLCGVLGYHHLTASTPYEAHQLFAQEDAGSFGGSFGSHGPADLLYTATLFVVSLGAALRLLLGRRRRPGFVRASHAALGSSLSAFMLLLTRAPSQSRLQVFLL
ncbi:hypothetical protein [Rubrobacter xylanophilus]|nr:hypothetical protein [Rubrobacter xylanophilus]